MAFPHYRGKHKIDAVVTIADFLKPARIPKEKFKLPEKFIFSFSQPLVDDAVKRLQTQEYPGGCANIFVLPDVNVGIVRKAGAGASAMLLEELAYRGVKRVISIGWAGGLQKNTTAGEIVLCSKAIRDEGISHHYAAPGKYAYPSKELNAKLEQEMKTRGMEYLKGPSWTIEAFFRETIAEVKQYSNEGVLTVEMEAAALFTVAKCLDLEFSSLFVISDSVTDPKWKPYDQKEIDLGMNAIFDIALETLRNSD